MYFFYNESVFHYCPCRKRGDSFGHEIVFSNFSNSNEYTYLNHYSHRKNIFFKYYIKFTH